MITITDLWLYPVKSLRGYRVKSATLTSLGFEWDRHWMLIDEKGRFLTQRKNPKMVFITTALTDSHLVLSKQGMQDCTVPLRYPKTSSGKTASIWKDSCEVIFEDDTVNTWLQDALETTEKLFLVRMKKGTQRTQSKAHLLGENTRTLFADAAPFLIANTASLDLINQILLTKGMEKVSMEQFRPNIIIDGIDAFEEHHIKRLKHTLYTLEHCYPCQRCIMPTINLTTAQAHTAQEPFMTLMGINTMPGDAKAPAFGENGILTKGENKSITVGDTLETH